MFLNYLFNLMIVSVDFELERRIMQILHGSGPKLFTEIQPECIGIALNLQGMLVERNQKCWVAVLATFGGNLITKKRFSRARHSDHQGHRRLVHAAAENRVEGL